MPLKEQSPENEKTPMSFGKRLGFCFLTFGLPIFLLSVWMDWKDYGPLTFIDASFEAVGGSFFVCIIEYFVRTRR